MIEKINVTKAEKTELSGLDGLLRHEYPSLAGKNPDYLIQYVSRTDALIGEIDRLRKETPDKDSTIIWLDKSARPVSWFYRDFYDLLLPQENPGQKLEQPHHSFLNIDRETWQNILGLLTDGVGITWNRLPEGRIDDIRKIFQFWPQIQKSNIFVVDEVKNSGTTLEISTGMIQRAFPEANVRGLYWMNNGYKIDKRSGQTMNAEVPLWYSDREITGRLVANIDSSKSVRSPSLTQRLGKLFLSTNFKDGPDEKGLRLKREIHQLATAITNHQIPFVPGVLEDYYGLETIEQRISRLNGMPFEDFKEIRRQSQDDYLKFILLSREYHHLPITA